MLFDQNVLSRVSINTFAKTLFHAGENISKYTEIGDFVGIGQTTIQIPGWDINYDFILAKVLLVL